MQSTTLETLQRDFCSIDVNRLLAEKPQNESVLNDEPAGLATIADTIISFVQEVARFRKRFPDSQLNWSLLKSDIWKATLDQLEPKLSSSE